MIDPSPPGRRLPRPARIEDRPPVRVTRDLWWHCFDVSLIVVAVVVLAAWFLPRTVPLPMVTAILVVTTAVTWWVTLRNTASVALSSWLLACGAFITCWFTAARMLGPWTQDVIAALVLGFVILVPLGPTAIGRYRAGGSGDPGAADRARQRAELASWGRLFFRAARVRNVDVTSVVRHPNGLEVHGYLGKATDEHGVVTYDKLKALGAEIATDLRLAADAVTFEQPDADNSAAFTMHVRTRKGKRKTAYLPENARFTTITEALELGLHDNGGKFRLLLREIAVMIVGVIGSGKSNLLNAFIGQLARCEDALVFCIDLKGGVMGRPWMMPWIEDPYLVRRPVIDWLATTRREAKLMLETLIEAGDYRARHGGVAEKITPRKNRPAIVLIMDETAVATGHGRKDDETSSRELAVLLARLAETYRAMAILPVVAAVRGDVETMGLTAIKAQALARIGLQVSQSEDADSIFPDDHSHAKLLAKIRDEGAGLVLLKGRMSSPVHFYRVTPKLAYRIAARTGPYRPVPDPVLEAGLGEAYATRWDRFEETRADWKASAAEWKEEAGIREDDGRPPARTATAVLDRPAPGPGGGGDDGNPEDYIDSVLREVAASVEDPEGKIHPGRRRMRELLYKAGPDGLTVGALNKALCTEAARSGNPGLAAHRGTIHGWLRKDEENGRVRRSGGLLGDPYARWIWIAQAGDDSPLGGLSGGPRDGEDDW